MSDLQSINTTTTASSSSSATDLQSVKLAPASNAEVYGSLAGGTLVGHASPSGDNMLGVTGKGLTPSMNDADVNDRRALQRDLVKWALTGRLRRMKKAVEKVRKNNLKEGAKIITLDPNYFDSRRSPDRSMLTAAADGGHLDVVQWLLNDSPIRPDPNKMSRKDGQNALHIAASRGHTQICRTLKLAGADCSKLSKAGYHAIHIASNFGHLSTVKFLIEEDVVKANFPDKKRHRTGAHYAAERGHLDIVKYLVQCPGAVNKAIDLQGQMLIHRATAFGQSKVVEYLLEIGTDISAKDSSGSKPIHFAARSGSVRLMTWFLDTHHLNVETENNLGQTALHFAAHRGQYAMVKYLVEKRKASINPLDSRGHTPLSMALQQSRMDSYDQAVVDFLRTVGGKVKRNWCQTFKMIISISMGLAALSATGIQLTSIPFDRVFVAIDWPEDYETFRTILDYASLLNFDLAFPQLKLTFFELYFGLLAVLFAYLVQLHFFAYFNRSWFGLNGMAWAFTTVLFLPLSRSIARVFDCTQTDGVGWTLDANPEVLCYESEQHLLAILIAVLLIPLYIMWTFRLIRVDGHFQRLDTSLGLFTWKEDDHRLLVHELHFMQKSSTGKYFVLYFQLAIKFSIQALAIFIGSDPSTLQSISIFLAAALVVSAVLTPFYLRPRVNAFATGLYCSITWCYITAYFQSATNVPFTAIEIDIDFSFSVFAIGYLVAWVGGALLFYFRQAITCNLRSANTKQRALVKTISARRRETENVSDFVAIKIETPAGGDATDGDDTPSIMSAPSRGSADTRRSSISSNNSGTAAPAALPMIGAHTLAADSGAL